MAVPAPGEVSVSGAGAQQVLSEESRDDDKYGGSYLVRRAWKRVPTPDPVCSSIGQFMAETHNRPHVLERILHADVGDPELHMEDSPPYVRAHPKGVSLAAFPGVAEIALSNKHGIIIVGNVAFRNPSETVSVGGICSFNPQLMNCIPSTGATPVPTFIYTMRSTPLMRTAARSPQGGATDKAMEAPAGAVTTFPSGLRNYSVQMDTGHTVTVNGATNQEEARAHAMCKTSAAGTGYRVSRITDLGPVSSPFGEREQPVAGASTFHKGIDIAAPAGTPIPAVEDGMVKAAGYSDSLGNYVEIEHPDGTTSKYAHMQSTPAVVAGQRVAGGDTLGQVGSTGVSTGNHLHFEVHDPTGKPVDPLTYNPAKASRGISV